METKDKRAKVRNIAARYSVATVGLAFVAIGISFAVQSNLGVSALNGVQYACAVKYPRFSFGDFNFALFSLLILVQLAVLRKEFKLIDLLQLVANAMLGYMADGFVWILNHLGMVPGTLEIRFFYILVSCIVTAFGVSLEVAARAWMLPAEMTVNAFTRAFGGKFSNNKVIMDSTLLVISCILCLVFWKNLLGPSEQPILGIGTLVSAVAVGLMMRLTDPLVQWLLRKLKVESF